MLRAVVAACVMTGLVVGTSCATRDPLHPASAAAIPASFGAGSDAGTGEHSIVLVAIDGVRWQEIFHGVEQKRALDAGMSPAEVLSARALIPNLSTLRERGTALGPDRIAASGPEFISQPGYMELMTGSRETGCTTNACSRVRIPTLADDFARQSGVAPDEVAVIASWSGVGPAAAVDPTRVTVSVGRDGGLTRDRLRFDAQARALLDTAAEAPPAPGSGDYRPDALTAEIAIHYLRKKRPRFMFLSLGDTDEHAHRGDYPGYLRALAHADWVVGRIAGVLAEHERSGRRATLIVTTDHGRENEFANHGAHAPESAAVWLIAAGAGIEPGRLGRVSRLADVATAVRTIAGVGSVVPSDA